MSLKMKGNADGIRRLKRFAETRERFIRSAGKKFQQQLAEVHRDAICEAINAGVDIDGAALKPNSPTWAKYKQGKYGHSNPLIQKGWMANPTNWIAKVIARRAGYIDTMVYPKWMGKIMGYLREKGYWSSFGVAREILDAFHAGVASIAAEAWEQYGKAKDRMSSSWHGRGKVVRGSRRSY